MISDIQKHPSHYLVLGILLSTHAVLMWVLRLSHSGKQFVVISLGVSYLAWGLIHHHLTGDTHKRIIIEYILVSALAATMLLFML